MKIVISLICFVVGIFSFTNAAGLDIERSCLKNGGPQAFANLKNNMEKTKTYFNSVQVDFTQALQKKGNKPEDAIVLVCNKVKDHSLENHLKDVIQSLIVCMEKDRQQGLDIASKMMISSLQFACENIKLLEKALTSPEIQCAASKDKALQSCSDIFTARIPNANTPNLMEPPANMTDVLLALKPSFDIVGCGKLLAFEVCTTKVMKQCNDDVFEELLDSYYKYINNDIPCEILPKSSRSNASPTSVISFMILFISLITMSF